MYPKIYLDYFRSFNRSDEVFVAMPFAEEFNDRWEKIFQPAISETGLQPYRVDTCKVSDSILIDVLSGIGRARVIVVDTSFLFQNDLPLGPNANVMYELGIAQAIRLPEEVLVIRDSRSTNPTPFDITHIRYHQFDFEDETSARATLQGLIRSTLEAIEVTKDLIVSKIVMALDPDSMNFLGTVGSRDWFDLYPFDPDRKGLYGLGYRDSSEGELRTIARYLIELGLLSAGDPGPMDERIYGAVKEYIVTDLGKVVWQTLPEWCKPDD